MTRLEAFLFIALRDYMTFGQAEEIIQKHLGDKTTFLPTNEKMENYIKDLLKRIQKP